MIMFLAGLVAGVLLMLLGLFGLAAAARYVDAQTDPSIMPRQEWQRRG
jgi:hypothetical protein